MLVRGRLNTEIKLECHRCLSTFTRPVQFSLVQEFAEEPGDDQMPIIDDVIDIAELAEQEIILGTPIKVLCRPDCPGIVDAVGRYNKEDDNDTRVSSRARITKGPKRGRT